MSSLEFSEPKSKDSGLSVESLNLLQLTARNKPTLLAEIPTESSSTTSDATKLTTVPIENNSTPVSTAKSPAIPTENNSTSVNTLKPSSQPVKYGIPTETPVTVPVPTETIQSVPPSVVNFPSPFSIFRVPPLVEQQPPTPVKEIPPPILVPPNPPKLEPPPPLPPPPKVEVPPTPPNPPEMCRIPTRAFTGEGDIARVTDDNKYPQRDVTAGHAHLRIPKIGLDLDVDRSGLGMDEGDMKHATEWVAPKNKNHLGLWTCEIPGKTLINGHVTLTDKHGHTGPGPLFNLHKLKVGDQVTLENAHGEKSTYRMVSSEVIKPNETAKWNRVFSAGDPKHPELDIVTCAGPYEHGYHRDNLVVRFEQIGVKPVVNPVSKPIVSKVVDNPPPTPLPQTQPASRNAELLKGTVELGIAQTQPLPTVPKIVENKSPQQPQNDLTAGVALGQNGQVLPSLEIEHKTGSNTSLFGGINGDSVNAGAAYYPINNRSWTVGASGEINYAGSQVFNTNFALANPGFGIESELFARKQWNDFGAYAAAKYATNPSQAGAEFGLQAKVSPSVQLKIGEQYSSVNFLDQSATPQVKYSPALYTIIGAEDKLSSTTSVGGKIFIGPQSGADLEIKFKF